MDDKQLEQFKQAVDEKNAKAKAENADGTIDTDDIERDMKAEAEAAQDHEHQTIAADTTQDTRDVRKKNSGKGQVTADKWNQ